MPRPKNKFVRFYRKLKWFLTVYIWPQHDATIQTLNGLLTFDSRDRALGRTLHVEREFEFDGMQEVYNFLLKNKYIENPENGIVLDVGGYIGMISTGFVLSGMFKKAVTIEPNPRNFQLIKKNIAQNKLDDRVYAFNMALSDCDDVLEMELSTKNFGDHRIRNKETTVEDYSNESSRKTIKVDSVKLDHFYTAHPELELDDIKLVWMDIQGHEGKFINGAREFFLRNKKVPIVMEFWPYAIKRSGMDKQKFIDTVSELFNSCMVEGERELFPISKVADLFDRFEAPDKGAHLILLNT